MSQSKFMQRWEWKSVTLMSCSGAKPSYPIFVLYNATCNTVCLLFLNGFKCLSGNILSNRIISIHLVVLFALKCTPTLLPNYFWNVRFYYIAANLLRMCLWWLHNKFHHAGNYVFCGLNYSDENSSSQPCLELKTLLLMRHKMKTLRILKLLNACCRTTYLCQ